MEKNETPPHPPDPIRHCNGGCTFWRCGRARGHVGPCQPATTPAITVRDLTLDEQSSLCPGCRLGRCDWGALHDERVADEIERIGLDLDGWNGWRVYAGTRLRECDCCGERHPRELFSCSLAADNASGSDTAACQRCSS